MASFKRTHTCGELTAQNAGALVHLVGWVHRRRDHGGLIFIDLRDRFGLTQLVFNPKILPQHHAKASELRAEWVISVKGKVVMRAPNMANLSLKSGEIEIEVHELEILSKAKTPPFSIADDRIEVSEELRLKYRYLDMRRGEIAKRLIARHHLMQNTRNYLSEQNFIEITTPVLAKSTPEGARDYLVPSRVHPGAFYALPQSPQIFKQLLMVGGMDRYFQIATCFRDEDLRADRQPEFTQIDLEMSFSTQNDLFPIIEGLMQKLFKTTIDLDLPLPFRRLTYKESAELYGSDKPDLRFGMAFSRLTDIVKEIPCPPIVSSIEKGAIAKGFCVKGGADASRKILDGYGEFVTKFGVGGLSWIKLEGDRFSSNIAKFLNDQSSKALMQKLNAETSDLIVFVVGKEKAVNQSLDHLRRHIAKERNLIPKNSYAMLWITDFPLFQWDEESSSYVCEHHPFTSPNLDDLELLETDPLNARSSSYDLVLNGYEIASGSQRIHDGDLQAKIFKLLNLSSAEVKKRFGFFIEALSYGTPPHLGIALGFDRISMILSDAEGIRDVIAFPKTQKAQDLMLEAPSEVQDGQLFELKLRVERDDIPKK